ncbi:MAG: PAS domain S-box protein [Anaerolineae bacterium]
MLPKLNRNSIALRYLLLVGSVLVLGQLLFALFIIVTNFTQQQDDLHQKAVTQVNFLSSVIPNDMLANNFYPLETLMRQTSQDSDFVYSMVIHLDGRVLTNYLNAEDKYIEDAISNAEEQNTLGIVNYLANNPDIIEVKSQVISEGLLIGEVRLGYTSENLDSRLRSSIFRTLALSALIGVILFLLTMVQFNRQIQRPIEALNTAANEFAAGNFEARSKITGNNELNQLQINFNSMAFQLQDNLLELVKLSHVASRTKNMVVVCDRFGRIEWINEAFTQITDYTLAEVAGISPGHILQGPKTDPDTIAYMRERVNNGLDFECELINYNKAGNEYWVKVEAQPVYDDDHELINFIAIETDITEQKRSETRIKESEALKSGILTTALDGIISIDHLGKIIEFNPAAEAIFGHKKADVIGLEMADLIIPEQLRQDHSKGFNAFLKTGSGKVIGRRIELLALHADGTKFPAEIAITALEHGENPVFTAHLRDITEKKMNETRLTEYADDMALANIELYSQQNRFRSLLDIATNTNLENSSELASAIEQGAKSLKMPIGVLSHIENDRFNIIEAYSDEMPLAKGASCPLEMTICQKTISNDSIYAAVDIESDSNQAPTWFGDTPLKGYIGTTIKVNGKLYGTLSFLTPHKRNEFSESESDFVNLLAQWISVTLERQQSRSTLVSYAHELERSNKELIDFAYVASHDLQEPLRKIQAFGSRLESKYVGVLDEKGIDYLSRMQNAASRMQILINELLNYSRVTTKAKPFEPTDLQEVMLGVLSDLEISIEQKDALINLVPLAKIDADGVQIRQLFQNIVGNALKFTVPDRRPEITITGIVTPAKNGADLYEIEISDNGIGFDEKYVSKIFGIFQRLHGRSEYAGTGVGLAICKKIIDRHSGNIIVNSEIDKGSTFRIQLPVHQENVAI